MAFPSVGEIEQAENLGRETVQLEPRAKSVRYEEAGDRIVIDLVNGSTFAFPRRLVQGLEDATFAQLSSVEVLGVGLGLHWQDLDVDVSLAGLLAGRFGTRAHMEQLARNPVTSRAA